MDTLDVSDAAKGLLCSACPVCGQALRILISHAAWESLVAAESENETERKLRSVLDWCGIAKSRLSFVAAVEDDYGEDIAEVHHIAVPEGVMEVQYGPKDTITVRLPGESDTD